MKLTKYILTLTIAQLIVIGLLNIPNTIISSANACHRHSSTPCSVTVGVSVIVFAGSILWFTMIVLMSYFTQNRRDRLLSLLLIGSELITLAAVYLDYKGASYLLASITGILDGIFAFMVIVSTGILFLYGNRRVVRGRLTHKLKEEVKGRTRTRPNSRL